MSITAMKQALEALIASEHLLEIKVNKAIERDAADAWVREKEAELRQHKKAITSLRQAVEEASSVSSIQSDKTSDAEKQEHHAKDCALLQIPSKDCDCSQKQEPVAWMHTNAIGHVYFRKNPQDKTLNPVPLYTTPPQRTWVGLTDEEVITMSRYDLEYAALIGEVERKLKEKNT